MIRILLNWLISGVSLILVAQIVKGIEISGFGTALFAALIYGIVSVTFGLLLKIVTFPLIVLTLGLFWFVINGLMLMLAAALVPGFRVNGLFPAVIGAILLTIIQYLLSLLLKL